jgi:hypothetical protein
VPPGVDHAKGAVRRGPQPVPDSRRGADRDIGGWGHGTDASGEALPFPM